MSVTLTVNYKEIFATETVEKIDEFLEDNYALDDILEFVDQYSEEDFQLYYEEYVNQGENVGYEVVDAFVDYHGLADVEHVEDAYRGRYDSFEQYAEEYFDDVYGHEVPENLRSYIDYDKFARDLEYDFDFVDGFVFDKNW